MDIKSNWGDLFYIGMCGIELFDDSGNQIKIKEASFSNDGNIL